MQSRFCWHNSAFGIDRCYRIVTFTKSYKHRNSKIVVTSQHANQWNCILMSKSHEELRLFYSIWVKSKQLRYLYPKYLHKVYVNLYLCWNCPFLLEIHQQQQQQNEECCGATLSILINAYLNFEYKKMFSSQKIKTIVLNVHLLMNFSYK